MKARCLNCNRVWLYKDDNCPYCQKETEMEIGCTIENKFYDLLRDIKEQNKNYIDLERVEEIMTEYFVKKRKITNSSVIIGVIGLCSIPFSTAGGIILILLGVALNFVVKGMLKKAKDEAIEDLAV